MKKKRKRMEDQATNTTILEGPVLVVSWKRKRRLVQVEAMISPSTGCWVSLGGGTLRNFIQVLHSPTVAVLIRLNAGSGCRLRRFRIINPYKVIGISVFRETTPLGQPFR